MQQILLPAIGPYVIFWHDLPDGRSLPLHWLDPEYPDLYYPYALFSYHFWTNKEAIRKMASIGMHGEGPGDKVVFGDSGGYSVVTKGAVIDPEEALKWQLRYCQRGVMLDIPPYSRDSKIQFTGSAEGFWRDSITTAAENVRRALPHYLRAREAGSDFRWWGVIQGETREQMLEWYTVISDIYPFNEEGEGWALAPKPSTDLPAVVRHLKFAHDHGIRNIHLLQVTSVKVMAVVFALAQMEGGFDLITYDSATAVRCAINRNAVIPDDINLGIWYIKQKGMEGVVQDFMMECPCQYCVWFRENQHCMDNRAYTHYLVAHNHLEMLKSFNRIWEVAHDDPQLLLNWVFGSRPSELLTEWERGEMMRKAQMKNAGMLRRAKTSTWAERAAAR